MRIALLLTLAGLGGCTIAPSSGPLQPQAVSGPCQVKPFFLVGFSASPVSMTVGGNGQACRFTVVNPDLQAFQTAALVTSPAQHGVAGAGLANGGTSAGVSYTPAPGYVGPDHFSVTIEPGDRALSVSVTVAR